MVFSIYRAGYGRRLGYATSLFSHFQSQRDDLLNAQRLSFGPDLLPLLFAELRFEPIQHRRGQTTWRRCTS